MNSVHHDRCLARERAAPPCRSHNTGYKITSNPTLRPLLPLRYKGKFVSSHMTVGDLNVPAKDANAVKVSVMKGARREKGPDPLGHRKTMEDASKGTEKIETVKRPPAE